MSNAIFHLSSQGEKNYEKINSSHQNWLAVTFKLICMV